MNILLVDDHIMTLEGYESILNKKDNIIFKAQTCEEVYNILNRGVFFDLAIIDYNLPPFPERQLFSGIDCALLLKQKVLTCKIILITAHVEYIELYSMYQKVRPDALFLKEDLTIEHFKSIVYSNKSELFLSEGAKKAVEFVRRKESLLNETNVEIVMYLSKGFKISELSDIIGLSKSAIQKRISKMQLEFNVYDSSGLIKIMHELNYF